MNLSHESGLKRWNSEYLHRSYITWRVLYVHRQVYITQLLTNGAQNLPSHPRWLCSTCNLEENDMKMLVGIFSNALYTYAPNCRKIPQKDGWGWVYKSNRSHLRVLLVKHTNIMYIYFFNFNSAYWKIAKKSLG